MVRIKKVTTYGSLNKQAPNSTNVSIPQKTGFAYPVDDGKGFYFGKSSGKALIKNNLHQLIKTLLGERVMLPSFGLDLHTHLFENLTSSDIVIIGEKITETLELFFPSIEVRGVRINDIVHYSKEGGIFTPEDFPQRREELDSIGDTLSNSLTISLDLYYKDLDELLEMEVSL
jgi:phage baseplate assembly protein W